MLTLLTIVNNVKWNNNNASLSNDSRWCQTVHYLVIDNADADVDADADTDADVDADVERLPTYSQQLLRRGVQQMHQMGKSNRNEQQH